MIKLSHVNKKWDSFHLEDISFFLPKGYIMGLVGANGAGKTTLLKMIMGVCMADAGSILVNGMDVRMFEREIKDEIGFVFRENLFWRHETLADCANQAGMLYSRYDANLFLELLREFALDKKKKVGHLSDGERMKFQFAFALSHDPKLLLMDEATGSFDPVFRKKMQQKMTDFVSDGEHSILFSSHVTEEMDRIADYITFVDHGKLLFSMDRESLLEKYRLVDGPKYKIDLLRKDDVVYKEHTEFGSRALIEYYPQHFHPDAFQMSFHENLKKPSLDELFYYLMKCENKTERRYGLSK